MDDDNTNYLDLLKVASVPFGKHSTSWQRLQDVALRKDQTRCLKILEHKRLSLRKTNAAFKLGK